ncbi:MAG TPA: hypothetical protein VJP79_08855 [Nitrososphaera sp.]|nr:hypothetical protein [Nitrososphaera sp.]
MKRILPNERILNVDHVLIPSGVLKTFVEGAFSAVMPQMKDELLRDMINSGIRFDDKTAHHSLSQIRDYLHLVLGPNAAEILVDALRNSLESTGQFEKYG